MPVAHLGEQVCKDHKWLGLCRNFAAICLSERDILSVEDAGQPQHLSSTGAAPTPHGQH